MYDIELFSFDTRASKCWRIKHQITIPKTINNIFLIIEHRSRSRIRWNVINRPSGFVTWRLGCVTWQNVTNIRNNHFKFSLSKLDNKVKAICYSRFITNKNRNIWNIMIEFTLGIWSCPNYTPLYALQSLSMCMCVF